VGQTRIFAGALNEGRQALVYAMRVELDSELAMLLPVPIPPGAGEQAVEFRDLSGCADFFEHLDALFPSTGHAPAFLSRAPVRQTLEVKVVGDFDASFVPTPADFVRLDPRFRLPDGAFERLPQYADYGFAVFKLRPVGRGVFRRAGVQHVHPMAFTFPRREPTQLFFPTVHVHDGAAHERALFDHSLYCQPGGALSRLLSWERSRSGPGPEVAPAATQGCIDRAEPVFRDTLFGPLSNRDYHLRPPRHDASRLRGAGEHYEYEARCHWAFAFEAETDPYRRWKHTSETQFERVQGNLFEGLPELCRARAAEWKLRPLAPSLPKYFMNGPQLYRGTDYTNGTAALVPGPAAVAFTAFSDHVEAQHIVFAFSELPSREMTDTIRAELSGLLDRGITTPALDANSN
jgi:hypothetical protein